MPAYVPAGVGSLLGLDSGSTWEDRLQEGAYTSPKGTRIKYEFTDLRRTYTLRGTAFEFDGVDDAYVQRKGFGPRRYPMACFFSGADHDRIATAFESALLEDGLGRLEHPLYGTFDVVPLGEVTRRDDLVTAANQSVIEVTFWTTLRSVYPRGAANPKSEIEAALGDFDVVAAQQFEASTDLATTVTKANAKATIRGFLQDVSAALSSATEATASVRREFDDAFRLVNFGIDVLVGQPLLLARQITNLITAPARAVGGIQSRLDGYARLAESIFGSNAGSPTAAAVAAVSLTRRTKTSNDFHISDQFAMSAVSGTVASLIEHQFATKPEALSAADEMLAQFDQLVAWRDAGFGVLGEVDPGGAYQALQEAAALTAGFLIQVSFQLVPERRIVLDRPRTIVDLAAEIYGSVDDRLDLLISSNDLTGSEILELPRGKVIRYYPTPT